MTSSESTGTGDLHQENKSDCKTVDSSHTHEDHSCNNNGIDFNQLGSQHSENISEKEENQMRGSLNYSNLSRDPSASFAKDVKEEIITTSTMKTEDDAKIADNKIKETEGISNSVSKICGLEESVSDSSENNAQETGGISTSLTNLCGLEKPVFDTSSTTSPSLVLPELLCAKSTTGRLMRELDEKMAIVSLDSPCNTKALLHWNRLWRSSKEVEEISRWKDTAEKILKMSARRVEGYDDFDYQAIYAYLGHDENTSESSYEPELNVFSKKQEEVEMLEKDLQLFQYLSRINSLATNC